MAKYNGPKVKISRRLGVPIFGPSKYFERKNYPPGVHGPKSRRKLTDYGVGLAEKQKLRYTYGLLERQFRRFFANALKKRGVTGETLLQMLELRLDNIVFRLGLAPSRPAARQMVSHGHVKVNGRRVNIASYQVKSGDVIEVKNSAVTRQLVARSLEAAQIRTIPDWLTLDKEALKGTVSRIPSREDIQPNVNEQLVVEFYSR